MTKLSHFSAFCVLSFSAPPPASPLDLLRRPLFLVSALHQRRLQAFVQLEMAQPRSSYYLKKGKRVIP
jgi:hypothetical protein